MSKFKVGDKIEYDPDDTSGFYYATSLDLEFDGRPLWARDCHLEPILKRPELGSIEELSQILGGWKPGVSKPVREVV